jgi:hypothetical protein
MTEAWDKDAFILRAIDAGVIRPFKDGRIKRVGNDAPKEIKFSTHKKSGRIYFTLTFEGISKSVLVNRVLGLAFLPNPLNLPEVNHIDGDKSHNWIERFDVNPRCNLEWCSKADNEKHAHGTGLKTSRGSSNGNAKLTPEAVQIIRSMPTASLVEIAQCLNARDVRISFKTIRDVLSRKSWDHI